MFGYRLLHDRDPAGTLDWFGVVASTGEVHNTCIALRESNAVTTDKHLLNRRNSHLVCQSYICASIVQSLRGMYESIYENSLRTDSGTVHCRVIEMFRQESLPVSRVRKELLNLLNSPSGFNLAKGCILPLNYFNEGFQMKALSLLVKSKRWNE